MKALSSKTVKAIDKHGAAECMDAYNNRLMPTAMACKFFKINERQLAERLAAGSEMAQVTYDNAVERGERECP